MIANKSLHQNYEKFNKEESKRDFYRNDNEISEKEDSSDVSDSIEEEESEEILEGESEENDADQHQIDFLLKDHTNDAEDQASVTILGKYRRQERTEKTVIQNAQTIYQIKLRHRIDVSNDNSDSDSEDDRKCYEIYINIY